jgi:hypothetical protein
MTAFDASHGGAVLVPPGKTVGVGVVLQPGRYIAYADVVSDGRPHVHERFIAPVDVMSSR